MILTNDCFKEVAISTVALKKAAARKSLLKKEPKKKIVTECNNSSGRRSNIIKDATQRNSEEVAEEYLNQGKGKKSTSRKRKG